MIGYKVPKQVIEDMRRYIDQFDMADVYASGMDAVVEEIEARSLEELDNPWHTGTPLEKGEYFVAFRWGLDNKIMHDMASRILYGATTFEGGSWKVDYPYVVEAWMPIPPYEEQKRARQQ